MRIALLLYLPGPVFFFYSLGYLLKHPGEWSGSVMIMLLSLGLTLSAHFLGKIISHKNSNWERTHHIFEISSVIGGLTIGIMLYLLF